MSSTLFTARGEQESRPPEKVEPERMQLWYSLMKSTRLCAGTRGQERGDRVTTREREREEGEKQEERIHNVT